MTQTQQFFYQEIKKKVLFPDQFWITEVIYRVEVARISWKFIQLWGSISLCKETEITNWISISLSNQRGFLFSESLLWEGEDIKSSGQCGNGIHADTLDNTVSPRWQLVSGLNTGDSGGYLWTRQMLTPRLLFQLIVPQPLIYVTSAAKTRGGSTEIIVILLTWLNRNIGSGQKRNHVSVLFNISMKFCIQFSFLSFVWCQPLMRSTPSISLSYRKSDTKVSLHKLKA